MTTGKMSYKGSNEGLRRFLKAIAQSRGADFKPGDLDLPLVVEDNIKTAIVPFEAQPAHQSAEPAYAASFATPVAATGYPTAMGRTYGRWPSSVGEWALVIYAMPFVYGDILARAAKKILSPNRSAFVK